MITAGETGRQLRRSVRHHLRGLGGSPREVAERLSCEGIRGLPGEPSDCALSRYLQAVVGAEPMVARIHVKERTVRMSHVGARLPTVIVLPRAVSGFVRNFDCGRYPHLIEVLGLLERGYAPGIGGDAGQAGETGPWRDGPDPDLEVFS